MRQRTRNSQFKYVLKKAVTITSVGCSLTSLKAKMDAHLRCRCYGSGLLLLGNIQLIA